MSDGGDESKMSDEKNAETTSLFSSGRFRALSPLAERILALLCLAWAAFHLMLAAEVFRMPAVKLRAIHLGAALVLVFALVPFKKSLKDKRPSLFDLLWVLAALAAMGYTYFRHDTLVRMGGRYNLLDIQMGILGLVVLFGAARRVVSPALSGRVHAAVRLFRTQLPEPNHVGYGKTDRAAPLPGEERVFGFILGVSAEIIMFVMFGAVLDTVEGRSSTDWPTRSGAPAAGRRR